MLRESTVASESGKTSMGAVEIVRLSRNKIKREFFIDFSVVSPDERRDDEQEEDEKKNLITIRAIILKFILLPDSRFLDG